jgi:large subunit ribosomal protein L3
MLHSPRHGSLAFRVRKRSEVITPRVNAWSKEKGVSGFAGYKAGMRHVLMIDDSDSPLKNQQVTKPVTIIEVPPVFVYSLTLYKKTPLGLKKTGEVCSTTHPKNLKRAVTPAKKSKKLEDFEFEEIRIVVATQPEKIKLKKKPEMIEIALGGSKQEQIEKAKELLGKELKFNEVFKEGEYVDCIAVTKGKGFQGVVKRFGVALNPMKATQARRHGGSIGPQRQAKVFYTIPRAGQMGFHKRTELNKRIMKYDEKELEMQHFGKARQYAIVEGSVAGPSKRIIILRKSIRKNTSRKPQIMQVI